jgi:hypothetical protein
MAQQAAFAVHVINPRKKSGKKKKATKKAAAKPAPKRKPMAKKAAKKKPAKRGASTTRAIARRAPNPPAKKKKKKGRGVKRRKGNPVSFTAVQNEMKSAIPRILGMMAAAWAVRRFGGHSGLFNTPLTSPMMGESWGWKQYAIAGAVATWGPALAGKIRINSTEFRRGAVDLIMIKLLWTEGFARSSWAQSAFGTGDVAYDPTNKQAYVQQGQRWDAMQGLVEASPLDGLVEASPLDGANQYQYGHYLPATDADRTAGKYIGTGVANKYHAAFQR